MVMNNWPAREGGSSERRRQQNRVRRGLLVVAFAALSVGAGVLGAADSDAANSKAISEAKTVVAEPKVDVSKLPPPAKKEISFAKDVKPILAKSCLDCHDADGAMGKFRLDKRDLALKGGEAGVDIVPGKSALSRLIHYVARLVKDEEMPPKDQGDPLTKEQISVLRAWIDQGAKWDQSGATESK